MNPWLGRAAAVTVGLTLALVLLELGLRAAAAGWERWLRREPAPELDRRRPVVLFLGDSNVYGLHVESEQTLPAQAQRLARGRFRALNLGLPGTPSWVALERARRFIPTWRPLAVVVRVGINNRVLIEPERERWFDRFRTVRLWRLLRGRLSEPVEGELTVTEAARDLELAPFVIRHAGFERPHLEVRHRLAADLDAIASLGRRVGATTFFMAYLDENVEFARVDRELLAAAERSHGVFVDCGSLTHAAIRLVERDQILYGDHHPTALGYQLEARLLIRAMIESGWKGLPAVEDPIAYLERNASHLPRRQRPARLAAGSAPAGGSRIRLMGQP